MAKQSAIPPKYHPECINLQQEGWTIQKITNYLLSQYNLDVSTTSVFRVLKNAKLEKQEATQKIYAEAAAVSAYKDMDIIDRAINKLEDEYNLSFSAGNKKEADMLLNTLIKFQAKRIELAGLGKNDQETNEFIATLTDEEADQAILSKIAPQRSNRSN